MPCTGRPAELCPLEFREDRTWCRGMCQPPGGRVRPGKVVMSVCRRPSPKSDDWSWVSCLHLLLPVASLDSPSFCMLLSPLQGPVPSSGIEGVPCSAKWLSVMSHGYMFQWEELPYVEWFRTCWYLPSTPCLLLQFQNWIHILLPRSRFLPVVTVVLWQP